MFHYNNSIDVYNELCTLYKKTDFIELWFLISDHGTALHLLNPFLFQQVFLVFPWILKSWICFSRVCLSILFSFSLSLFSSSSFFFGSIGFQILGLTLTGQVPYHFSHMPSPFKNLCYFADRVLILVWSHLQDSVLLHIASHLAWW
jgi:hypothetical protein